MSDKQTKAELFKMLAEAVRNTPPQPPIDATQPDPIHDAQPKPKRKAMPASKRTNKAQQDHTRQHQQGCAFAHYKTVG